MRAPSVHRSPPSHRFPLAAFRSPLGSPEPLLLPGLCNGRPRISPDRPEEAGSLDGSGEIFPPHY
jgi:hypothetical protein